MKAQIVLENVGIRLPQRILFEPFNWTVYEGMRVTLAGRNGSGKSTLLRIIAGHGEPTDGKRTVTGGKNLRIGFLDQAYLDHALSQTQKDTETQLGAADYLEKILEKRLGDEALDIHWEIRKILGGLGFSEELLDMSIQKLSGGWLLRMFIGMTLLEKPDLLLLDEPTNHLDISTIQWLEDFLKNEYQGSLILVTHDVALQKRTTDSLAILHGGLFYFRTHLQDYLSFQDSIKEDQRVLEKNIEALQKKVDENMEFVHKYRAKAQIAARAQSKLKTAEDWQQEVYQMKNRLERLRGFQYNFTFKFRMDHPGGRFPLTVKDLFFKYQHSNPWLLQNISFDVSRGQRIAIIGDNGTGKTTLLNLFAKRLPPSAGEMIYGHEVQIGYFGQHQLEELTLENTVIDNLKEKAPRGVSYEQLRGWLGAFGFSEDIEIEKKVKVLSGGERARLALLRILVSPVNVLLLDEPTNHLDIETKRLLREAILNFEGTTIMVSHDRDFIQGVADRIIHLSHEHELTDHLGDLSTFSEKYPQLVHVADGAKPSAPAVVSAPKPASNLSYEERKKIKNQIKSNEKKLAQVELDIDQIGGEKNKLQGDATSASPDKQKVLFGQIQLLEQQLHQKMVDWERISLELESLKKDSL